MSFKIGMEGPQEECVSRPPSRRLITATLDDQDQRWLRNWSMAVLSADRTMSCQRKCEKCRQGHAWHDALKKTCGPGLRCEYLLKWWFSCFSWCFLWWSILLRFWLTFVVWIITVIYGHLLSLTRTIINCDHHVFHSLPVGHIVRGYSKRPQCLAGAVKFGPVEFGPVELRPALRCRAWRGEEVTCALCRSFLLKLFASVSLYSNINDDDARENDVQPHHRRDHYRDRRHIHIDRISVSWWRDMEMNKSGVDMFEAPWPKPPASLPVERRDLSQCPHGAQRQQCPKRVPPSSRNSSVLQVPSRSRNPQVPITLWRVRRAPRNPPVPMMLRRVQKAPQQPRSRLSKFHPTWSRTSQPNCPLLVDVSPCLLAKPWPPQPKWLPPSPRCIWWVPLTPDRTAVRSSANVGGKQVAYTTTMTPYTVKTSTSTSTHIACPTMVR